MTRCFNNHLRLCSGDNEHVGLSVLVVSRWLWPGNRTFLEVASIVVTWWIVAFLAVTASMNSVQGRWGKGAVALNCFLPISHHGISIAYWQFPMWTILEKYHYLAIFQNWNSIWKYPVSETNIKMSLMAQWLRQESQRHEMLCPRSGR